MSPLQSRWYTVFLEYNIKVIQYVKGEKNALADALSRHPDPSSQPLDHLVPPFNMDVVGFHGLSASVATADQRGVHQLPAPQDLFGAGAVVQPVSPPDCPILQVWRQQPGMSKPSSVSLTMGDWRAAGYNVSAIILPFLQVFVTATPRAPSFVRCGRRWRAAMPAATFTLIFFLDNDAGLLFRHVVGPTSTAFVYQPWRGRKY
jgi:hypothetical protein